MIPDWSHFDLHACAIWQRGEGRRRSRRRKENKAGCNNTTQIFPLDPGWQKITQFHHIFPYKFLFFIFTIWNIFLDILPRAFSVFSSIAHGFFFLLFFWPSRGWRGEAGRERCKATFMRNIPAHYTLQSTSAVTSPTLLAPLRAVNRLWLLAIKKKEGQRFR